MKIRIVNIDTKFKIGDLEFKVIGIFPNKYGHINFNTYIKLNSCYSSKNIIERCLILSSRKLLNFHHNDLVDEIKNKNGIIVTKNEMLKVNNYEFFVRNSTPFSGVLTKDSKITIENKEILNIQKLHLAVIKKNHQEENSFNEEKTFQEYVHNSIFKPYFLSGVSRYIERGESIKIDEFDLFVLNCSPENGFVTCETRVKLIFGLSYENCLEKIQEADIKYVTNLNSISSISSIDSNEHSIQGQNQINHIENLTSYNNCLDEDGRLDEDLRPNESNRNQFNYNNIRSLFNSIVRRSENDRVLFRTAINNRIDSSNTEIENNYDQQTLAEYDQQMFIYSLPELQVDNSYLNYISIKKLDLDNITKCLICYSDFELNDVLKTLPCSIFFSFSSPFSFRLHNKVVK